MAEYIKREDALNAIRKSPISNMSTRLFCIDAIADIPAADVVEVVRCKDCKKYAEWNDGMICLRFGSWYGNMKPDDYCSLGSKRGEDDV